MTLPVLEEPIKFHLSLNVSDLPRSVAFYYQLFGVQPAKWHDDYAKFELDDPPVIFSLIPLAPGSGGVLSHLGFRVANEAGLQEMRERLEAAGLVFEEQRGTVCGYARQNKIWVKDPDGNFWEAYCIEEDMAPAKPQPDCTPTCQESGNEFSRLARPSVKQESLITWEHYVTHPLPERIPHEDGAVDEVRLTGTFNSSLDVAAQQFLVRESFRVLKPGGKVVVHGLLGDKLLAGEAKLPGLAALVSRVPAHAEVMEVLRRVGLVGLQLVKFTEQPWFVQDGVEMREVKLIAWKPAKATADAPHQVLYKGPFRQATLDGGRAFLRGQRVNVPEDVWQLLRFGVAAEQFVFLEPTTSATC